MSQYVKIFFIAFFTCLNLSANAQNRSELERKRQNIIEQIKIAQEQLKDIKKDRSVSMSELKALQAKLSARQALIANINQEIQSLDNTISQSSGEVAALSSRLESLKLRYAQSVRYAYSHRNSFSFMAFIFSSDSYNDAVRRLKYVRKLRNYRKDQVDNIRQTQTIIEKKITQLNSQKTKKSLLRHVEELQRNEIQKETNQTNGVVNALRSKENELASSIQRNQRSARKLDNAIDAAIKREIEIARKKALEEERKRQAEIARQKKIEEDRRRAEELAAAKASPPPTPTQEDKKGSPTFGTGGNAVRLNTGSNTNRGAAPTVAKSNPKEPTIAEASSPSKPAASMSYKMMLTPEATNLSNNFESNKGKLPWPVERGIISGTFGTHKHAVAEKVMVDNNGIDIQASAGSAVRSVFDGTVTSIFSVPGRGNVVLISHGVYFTVYSQLASVSVAKGQNVKTKQNIGAVGTNDDGASMINFQVWKVSSGNSTSKINPELWIAR